MAGLTPEEIEQKFQDIDWRIQSLEFTKCTQLEARIFSLELDVRELTDQNDKLLKRVDALESYERLCMRELCRLNLDEGETVTIWLE